jgi:4'-phosphopantetheinyl transferase
MATIEYTWLLPPTTLKLSSDEVHIWRVNLDQPAAQIQELAQSLTIDEQTRADHFYFDRHRRRFIVGRGVLRIILGQYLHLAPSQIHFCYGSYGKPALLETLDGDTLGFNLAHSHELALYAVVQGQELGVDLEHLRPIVETEQLVEYFFSVQEKAVWQALPPELQQEAFFSYWTCKEAYLKAQGVGLTHPLDQVDISLEPGESAKLLREANNSEAAWLIQMLTPAPQYIAALALPVIAQQKWRFKYWQWR